MAEAAGLAVGVLALAGTFKDCVELFSYFSVAKSFASDFELLATKLDIEKLVLLQWADRVRLLREDYDDRLDVDSTRKAVAQILASINSLLSNASELNTVYGVKQIASTEAIEVNNHISATRMESFRTEFERMNLRLAQERSDISPLRKLRWAIHDKQRFDRLIGQLTYFVSKLFILVPDWANGTSRMSKIDIQFLDPHNLRLLRCVVPSNHRALTNAVEQNWRKLVEKRVLDQLWFPAMDNRKAGVHLNHRRTFEWALQSQHDLLDWLEYGDDIYWLSGKAASGKSTLMKFLFQDERTKALLKKWAGELTLEMGSYFLWHVGMDEQKSQEGLARALLFHICRSNPSIIPAVLPGIWTEVENAFMPSASLESVSPPSKEEVRQAFEILKSCPLDRVKCCLFVDGLDELAGDHTEGIALIQNLAAMVNVKILVSSRPIAACETAFSSGPRLRLQDLTKEDIKLYVEDHIISHPNWKTISNDDGKPGQTSVLTAEIINKASGVFLWVVLACKSIREGLTNFDSIPELQSRIKELPPELEQIFALMLSKIEPRYEKEAARLLNIACHHNKIGSERPLCNLELSLTNQMGESVKKPDLRKLSAYERISRMIAIEGRLKSRCWGLLEAHPSVDLGHCAGPTSDDVPHRIIDFLHRTVFDFLESQEAQSISWLQAGKKSFDAFAALAWTNLHLYQMVLVEGLELYDTKEYVGYLLSCLRRARKSSFETIHALLRSLEETTIEPCKTRKADLWIQGVKDHSAKHKPISDITISPTTLVLTIEAGMVDFVEDVICTHEMDSSKVKDAIPLLEHAVRPHLWPERTCYPLPDMVALLLEAECDPNKSISIRDFDVSGRVSLKTTPWRLWAMTFKIYSAVERLLECDPRTVDNTSIGGIKLQSQMKITRLLVNAGADLGVFDDQLPSEFTPQRLEEILARIAPRLSDRQEADGLRMALSRRRDETVRQKINPPETMC